MARGGVGVGGKSGVSETRALQPADQSKPSPGLGTRQVREGFPPTSPADKIRISATVAETWRRGHSRQPSSKGQGTQEHTSERRWTYSQQPQTTTTLYPYVPSQAMGPLRTFHESQIQKLSQPSYPNASPFSLKEGSTLTSPEQRKEGFSLDDQILDDAMDLKDRLVFPRPCFLPPWAPGWEHTAVIGLGLVVRTQAAERRWAPREGTAFLRHVLVSISSHCCQTHARPLGLPSQSQVLNRNISSRTIYTGFSLGGCSWQVREN